MILVDKRYISPERQRMKDKLDAAVERDKESMGENWDEEMRIERQLDRLSQDHLDRVREYAEKHEVTYIEAKRILFVSRTKKVVEEKRKPQTLSEVF